VAVADLAGGNWPELARHAAVMLTRDRDQAASVSDRIRLLADCRTAFGDADALPSTILIGRLRADPEAPWCEPAPGITPERLAALLADYDIRSSQIRFGEPIGQVRGYYRADFTDAWARYCAPTLREPSQASQPSSSQGRIKSCDTSIRHTNPPVTSLTCDGDRYDGCDGYPRFDVIDGGAA
jgi:hypothetical protein